MNLLKLEHYAGLKIEQMNCENSPQQKQLSTCSLRNKN